jgi:hypothetical protein
VDIQRIEIRHVSGTVAERVRRWFETTRRVGKLDGSRSVRLPHPDKNGFDIKIKGAGFLGGPIRFGKYLRSGPTAPVFDFDGRVMEDVAAGHDNAFLGGASFQQAATEYAVTRMLAGLGFPVVPCLGYGRLATPVHESWFSIFEWDRAWEDAVAVLSVSVEEYLEANIHMGSLIVDLAASHDLIGYCSYVRTADGSYRFKDMHPFRRADPVSMSQLSWAMQVLFALHVRCQACLAFPHAAKLTDLPADLEAYPVRAILPDAEAADHKHLKSTIVRPYMLRPPAEFSSRDLLAALRRNRIASTVLKRCPERYARYDG